MSNEINNDNKIFKFGAKPSKNPKREAPDALATLLREIEKKQSHSAFHREIDSYVKKNSEMKYLSPNWYKSGEYYLKLGTKREEGLYRSRLPMLTEEGITISPIYCDSAVSKSGFSALLLRVPDTKSGDLHYFNDAYHLLSKKAKEAAYEDIRKIIEDMGFLNPAFFNPNNYGITPDSSNQRIILMNWEEFYPLFMRIGGADYDEVKEEVLKKAREVIFRK